jgi:predicted Zn-dependent peptidase
MMDAFVTGRNWEDAVHDLENARKLTKKDIVDFANKYYTNDYVVVYKRLGEDKSIVKVDKPPITQVSINRDEASPFAQSIINASAKEISPVFLDYKKDINHGQLKTGIPVYSVKNTENKRFTLYYTMDMGKNNDNKLPVAVEYLKFIGTDKYSAEQISREFYKLGCNFGIYTAYDRTTLYVTGLQENFDKAVDLFEHLLANAKPDQKALDGVVSNLIQERNNMKKNKDVILRQALVMYAKYGAKNPFNNNLSDAQLKSLKANEMVNYIHKLNSYEHRIYYYGPEDVATIENKLNEKHKVPAKLNAIPEGNKFVAHPIDKNKVYFVNYDMVQANIYWVAKDGEYNTATLPVASVFNEYFGGSMGSIVFQTLRESKALAYATSSRFETPSRREDPFFTTAYIGTQSDKMNEAINSMNDLLRDMPTTDLLLDNARKGLRSQIEAQRIIRQDILMNYDQAMRMGQDHDVRRDIYASLDKINMSDIRQFHKENCENRNYNYCVLASKEKINENDLTKYGTLEELTLQQIFGY